MHIFGDHGSGNCLKVKWTADLLGLPYRWTEIDILKGESRTPDFLAMNPAGQVPTVLFDDGRALGESNAIMRYLARGSRLLPDDPFVQAKIDGWLFWEQNAHEPNVAGARFRMVYLHQPASSVPEAMRVRGDAALDRLEAHFAGADWLVGDGLTIADIALVAYTRVAHEGGFDLGPRPALRGWITRCEKALGIAA
ncbi:MAG: glutathione S-transferase family protein [Alphaproteobacteria bacterium]|nr:glutathione S-transferase family protein [Alphaproteobacteria bacterium]